MQADPDHTNWKQNHYHNLLQTTGDIFMRYLDKDDKRIPFFGFGAIIPGGSGNQQERVQTTSKMTSHCFAMNGDIGDPYVDGT